MRPCVEPNCGELVDHGRCPDHAAEYERSIKARNPERRAVYSSKRWQQLRYQVFKSQGGRCATPGCLNLALELDHIKPLAEGGDAFDKANLQGLCKRCHSRKTISEVIHVK